MLGWAFAKSFRREESVIGSGQKFWNADRSVRGSLPHDPLHLQQLIGHDRQIPHPLTCHIKNGVGAGGGRADNPNLADTARGLKLRSGTSVNSMKIPADYRC